MGRTPIRLLRLEIDFRDRPHLVARAAEFAASDHACELFNEEAAFAATAEAKLANELFVTGPTASGAANSGDQVAISAGIRSPDHGL